MPSPPPPPPIETLDALKNAVVAQLQAVMTQTEFSCAVTPDGRPDPDAGQCFIAVHGGNITNDSVEVLDERCSFSVTITVRAGEMPWDRLQSQGKGLARQVKAAIHGDNGYTLTAFATAANPDVVFVEPPRFLSESDMQPKGTDWFFADEAEDGVTGLAIELRFGKARRIRYPNDLDTT